MATKMRTWILDWAGACLPVRAWFSRRCKRYGVQITKAVDAIELRRGGEAILLSPKHIFFAPQVCAAFEAFAVGAPAREQNGTQVTDFAGRPELFNACRGCLAHGAVLESRGDEIWLRKGDEAMILSPRHMVYAVDMAKSFDLYFAPLVPETRGGVKVLDYSRPGILQTYRSGLQFEMASFPEEEEAIEEYFRWYRPKLGDLVFDMGAHCGVSTYHLSKLVGEQGRVVAFEPDPVNCAILKRNVERHGLSNVVVENVAIAGTAGKLAFNSEGTIGSALVSLLQRDSVGSVVTVDAITLANAVERWGVPAFCKIDIEGAEVEVLAKSTDVLKEHPACYALDTNHPKTDGELTSGDVEAIFRSCGYEVLSEANPLLTTWARPK